MKVLSEKKICPICRKNAEAIPEDYHTGIMDKDGLSEIIVNNISVFKCKNSECGHLWLPLIEEQKIDKKILEILEDLAAKQEPIPEKYKKIMNDNLKDILA